MFLRGKYGILEFRGTIRFISDTRAGNSFPTYRTRKKRPTGGISWLGWNPVAEKQGEPQKSKKEKTEKGELSLGKLAGEFGPTWADLAG